MLNKIWCFFIIAGVFFGIATGKTELISKTVIESGSESVSLIITLLGITSLWNGILEIAKDSGLITALSKKLEPLLTFLFPDIPKNHASLKYISTNIAANFLGVSYAATPAGLMAMKEMQKLNRDKGTASKSMCMFMIINMSSVQLINMNIISCRAKYGSALPSEIVFTGIVATIISTLTGIIFTKIMERRERF